MSGTGTGPNQILDTFLAAMMAGLDTLQPLSQGVSTIVADGEIVAVGGMPNSRVRADRSNARN